MITSFKAGAIFAAAALILAMPLAAQNVTEELGSLESNTYKATSGLFGNDVDSVVDVHGYGDVLGEEATWFGFITGSTLDIEGHDAWQYFKPAKANNPTTGLLSVGYARQLGSLYLGLWYQGNAAQITGGFDGDKNVTKTSSLAPQYDAYKVLVETSEETTWNESWLNASNQIEVLVGVAGQGIKVGFYESLFSSVHKGAVRRMDTNGYFGNYRDVYDPLDPNVQPGDDGNPQYFPWIPSAGGTAASTIKVDHQNGVVEYTGATDEFYEKGGYLKPYLGWGSTFAVGENSLRPYVNVGATFYNDTKVDNYSDYTEVNGTKYGKTNNIAFGYDHSYIRPDIGVGAWFDLAAQEGKAAATIGIEYNLGLYIYNSSYAPTGFSGDNVKGTVTWKDNNAYVNRKTASLDNTITSTDITLEINEVSEMRHAITPTFILAGDPVENLSLGFSASVPVGIRTYSSDQHTEKHVITSQEYNTDRSQNSYNTTVTSSEFQSFAETNFGLGLDLAIGASYKLVPNRFTINAGVSATPCSFVNTVRTYKTPSNASIETVKATDGLGNVTSDTKTVTTMPQGGAQEWLVQQDQVESNLVWEGFSGNVTGGFTFFFTPGIALDLAAAWGRDSFNVDIADVNVLFSFKF